MTFTNHKEAPALKISVVETDLTPAPGRRKCVIGHHIRFLTDGLANYCFARFQPVIYDLLLLAAAVEVCDKSCRRPKHGWRRDFAIDIPVHDPDRWRALSISSCLRDALQFLTGDTWEITFTARVNPVDAPEQSFLPLPVNVAAVMPYSEGLDSRAVATIITKSLNGELIRVRLGSIHDPATSKRRQPFARVPYVVKPLDKSIESSGRSRSFKFTALAGIAAFLSDAPRIIMSESIQGSIGPVLVPVAHAYEDYRNHPLFTDHMAAFLEALFGRPFKFDYPRLWHTKGETITAALECNSRFDWRNTRSCWQQSRQVSLEGTRRQCGICAACLLRRMSLNTAGLCDPSGTYVWEDLSGPSFTAAPDPLFDPKKITQGQREYAIAGALHMDHLAEFNLAPANAEGLAHAAYQLSTSLGLQESRHR